MFLRQSYFSLSAHQLKLLVLISIIFVVLKLKLEQLANSSKLRIVKSSKQDLKKYNTKTTVALQSVQSKMKYLGQS